MAKKSRVPLISLKLIGMTIYSILFTLTVSLYKNLKTNYKTTLNPELKEQIKRELETEKMVKLLNEKIKTVERLVYGILEDPEYMKSDKGKYDIKQLKKEVK